MKSISYRHKNILHVNLKRCMMSEKKEENIINQQKIEEESKMATIVKTSMPAFMLRVDKMDEFLKRKNTSEKVLERFYAHKPKAGVKTPFKENDV